MTSDAEPDSLYARVGGDPFFARLTDAFYRQVASDDVLLRLYPDPDDLEPARERLFLFLLQYWGGPITYLEQRGHPRLRMRHAPYAIGPVERDRWLAAMDVALDEAGPAEAERAELDAYFRMAAEAMRNRD